MPGSDAYCRHLDEVSQVVSSLIVHGVEERAEHASRQKDLVDVADEGLDLGVGDASSVAEVGILALAPLQDPAILTPDEVRAKDDAVPVVLEALGGVDAADLSEARRVGRPQGRRRRTTDRPLAA